MALRMITIALLAASLTACSGVRTNGNVFTTHAESIRVLGWQIPDKDQDQALALVPAGGKIDTQISSPADWTSVIGIINNILGIGQTTISGTVPAKN